MCRTRAGRSLTFVALMITIKWCHAGDFLCVFQLLFDLFYTHLCCMITFSKCLWVLQSLHLMWKEKHHKSQKHSSVFSSGSLNQSVCEKADTSLSLGAEWRLSSLRFFWLLAHLSSSVFCCEALGEGDIQRLSPLYNVCFSSVLLHVEAVQRTHSPQHHKIC